MQYSSDCKKLLFEIESQLADLARNIDPEKARARAHFMKVTMPLLGLSVPQQRARLKKGYSFSSLDFVDQVPIWRYVWEHAKTHEVKMQAVLYVEKPTVAFDEEWLWDQLKPWAKSLNCWDQSDCLSRIYALLMEMRPDLVTPVFELWNESNNPWERRQSLVGLLFYSRFRKLYPDRALVFRLVQARLQDTDYYVQKGVGWTLREAFNVWPKETLALLDQHVTELAPAAWQAATEKLSPEDKAVLKAKRKGRSR